MKIILTNHSKQRRPHLKPQSEKFLISWMEYFKSQFYLKRRKKDGIYKISSAGSAAVIRKDGDELILITFRGFQDFKNRKDLKLTIKRQKDRVYRKDELGKIITCGDIKWAGEKSMVILRKQTLDLYQIPIKSDRIIFHKTEELKEFFYFKNGKWILKEYPKNENIKTVFRKNYKGRIVRCGELINGKLYLDYNLMQKYKIPVYQQNKEDNSKFIHLENGVWMLNEFKRINKKDLNS